MGIMLDILLNILPKGLSKKMSRIIFGDIAYCFLIHSRDYTDLYRRFPLLRYVPYSLLKFIGRNMCPVRAGYIHGLEYNGKKRRGIFIGSPMDAKDMIDNRELASHKIIRAARFADILV